MITAGCHQEPIVDVGLEQFFNTVEIEAEREEDFHVRSLHENAFVDFFGVFQIAHAHGVITFAITDGVQWV